MAKKKIFLLKKIKKIELENSENHMNEPFPWGFFERAHFLGGLHVSNLHTQRFRNHRIWAEIHMAGALLHKEWIKIECFQMSLHQNYIPVTPYI